MPFTDPPPSYAKVDGNYYIDYLDGLVSTPPDPDWGSASYITTQPENISADDAIGGEGNVSWEYSFSSLDVEGNSVLPSDDTEDFIHPWRSWWRLRCGDVVITSGPVTGTRSKLGEEFVSIAGKTWWAYFPRWQYPFDPRPAHVNDYRYDNTFMGNERPGHVFSTGGTGAPTPTGLSYQANSRDIALITRDLLVMIRDGVSDRLNMNFAELETPIGITTNYQYTLGDDSGIDSAISTLTGIGEGFDIWIGWDRIVHVGSPYRYGSNSSPSIEYIIDIDTPGMTDLEYQNDGIQGTHVLGRGAGLASQTQMGAAYGYAPSQDQFSRLDVAYDHGDVRNQTQLNNLTKKSLSLAINPVRHVPITIDPGIFDAETYVGAFWSTFRVGRAFYITVDTGFHQIDAPYRLTNWALKADGDNVGNMLVDLTLERIYNTVADFGNPDL